MEVAAIRTEILNKYKTLTDIAHIKPKNNIKVPYWKLKMGDWNISEGFEIWCGTKHLKREQEKQRKWQEEHPYESNWRVMTSKQYAREEKRNNYITADIGIDRFELKIKPFWMRTKRAMEIISETLDKFINNYNSEAVEKGEIPIVVYTKEFLDYLTGKNPDFKKIEYKD